MNEQERVRLVADIAAALGDDWAGRPGHDAYDGDGYLERRTEDCDERLYVRFGGYQTSDKGRLLICPVFDTELQGYGSYGEEFPEIRVSETRGAKVIAREIERRLLPPYRALLATRLEAKRESDQFESERAALAAQVAGALGGKVLPVGRSSAPEVLVGSRDTLHVSATVIGPGRATFQVEAYSADIADHVASMLAAILLWL